MMSALAIAIAGVSFVIVTITVYRNLPTEPTIVLKSDHGANGPTAPTLPPIPEHTELVLCDHELNLVL